METVATEFIETNDKHDTRGRRIVEEKRRAQLLAEYETSGLTQKAFARREGLNYYTFVAWLGKHRRHCKVGGRGGAIAGQALPAGELADGRPEARVRFAEVRLPTEGGISARVEVRLPDGTLVRGQDEAAIARLIRALRS